MTKVSDVIELMIPEFRKTLEEMMQRNSMNGDTTVDQLEDHFNNKIRSEDERIALANVKSAVYKLTSNKYAAKLSPANHCEILALYRMGYDASALAKAYNIDRKTVTHIYNPSSKKYKLAKQQEIRMGTPALIKVYVTDLVINHINTFQAAPGITNHKVANKKEGMHLMQNSACTFKHRVEIRWCEPEFHGVEVAGWYYKDLDSEFPDSWLRGKDEDMRDSQACYYYAMNDIQDPLS